MAAHPAIGEAFRRLQAGDAAGALELARRIGAEQPTNARARLAAGIALRMAGRLDEASVELTSAQALDPADHAAAYEVGIVRQLQGRLDEALAQFERCSQLRPDFFAAHFSAGLLRAERREWARAAERFRAVLSSQPDQPDALLHLAIALQFDGRHGEAEQAYVHALAANPHHAATLRAFGQYSASRGNFKRAATLFTEAARIEPDDQALPMYIAQCELLLGRFPAAWAAYARRDSRRAFERAAAARGAAYILPEPRALARCDVVIVGEQGLGDTLFFLRWAPLLKQAGARLAFSGDARLHPVLARTALFDAFHSSPPQAAHAILVGDLPAIFADVDPLELGTLRIDPLPERVERWRAVMQDAGPRPWVGTMWRAGTPREVSPYALEKSIPVGMLFGALRGFDGSLFALQPAASTEERGTASRAAARPVHDLGRVHVDLEDVLAVVRLLDRHVSVSNTNIHLAAAVGATADVLVPFPPEWRWRLEGDSPWFPGFRVHRQGADGDWSEALKAIV